MTEEYTEAIAPNPVSGGLIEEFEVDKKVTEQEITRAGRPRTPEDESVVSFEAPSSASARENILSQQTNDEVLDSVEQMMGGLIHVNAKDKSPSINRMVEKLAESYEQHESQQKSS